MSDSSEHAAGTRQFEPSQGVEMPRATIWPIVVALGITMLGAGWATNLLLSAVGAILFVLGLAGWISQLLPGAGICTSRWLGKPFVPVRLQGVPAPWISFGPGWRDTDFSSPSRSIPSRPE